MRHYLKTITLHFEAEYFGKKQSHNFRTLDTCYRF